MMLKTVPRSTVLLALRNSVDCQSWRGYIHGGGFKLGGGGGGLRGMGPPCYWISTCM